MTYVLDGGKACTARRHFIASPLQPMDGEIYHLDPHELLPHSVESFITTHKEFAKQDFKPTRDDLGYMTESTQHVGALNNHYGIFIPTIISNGTDK